MAGGSVGAYTLSWDDEPEPTSGRLFPRRGALTDVI